MVIWVWAGALGGPTHICIHFGLFQVSEFSFNTMMLDRQIRRRIIQLLDTYFAVLLLLVLLFSICLTQKTLCAFFSQNSISLLFVVFVYKQWLKTCMFFHLTEFYCSRSQFIDMTLRWLCRISQMNTIKWHIWYLRFGQWLFVISVGVCSNSWIFFPSK